MMVLRLNSLVRLTPLRAPIRSLPTAGKRLTTIHRYLSSTSSANNDDKFQMLDAFPEYKQARESALKGQFMQAIPLYTRVIEVLQSSTGKESELTLHATVQQIKTLLNNGDIDKATHLLQQTRKIVGTPKQGVMVEWGLVLFQLDALVALKLAYLCSDAAASPTATAVTDSSSGIDDLMANPTTPLEAISPTYGLKGLVYLSRGELDAAEDELQLAARWVM